MLVICSTLLLPTPAVNAQPTANQDFTKVANDLQQATLTIRVLRRSTNDAPDVAASVITSDEVEVFTGVALSDRYVIAPMLFDADAEIRFTLTDGEQATARPLVIDEYTGLTLLESSRPISHWSKLADAEPQVGQWVLSAAAWGIERPVVSYGMVGGVNRRIAGTNFPPLLLCDLRTAETSSGAPVVNANGELVGILVSTSRTSHESWSYAIPVKHVSRIISYLESRRGDALGVRDFANDGQSSLDAIRMRSRSDGRTSDNSDHNSQTSRGSSDSTRQSETAPNTIDMPLPFRGLFQYFNSPEEAIESAESSETNRANAEARDKETSQPVLVIPHRRPIVGMVLNDNGRGIEVRKLTPEGPAADAGIKLGDRIIGVEGTYIRSVYQAVTPTLHMQPGDVIQYQVLREGEVISVAVVLGGGVSLPASSLTMLDDLIEPKLRIQEMDARLALLGASSSDSEQTKLENQPTTSPAPSAVNLLERALGSYQTLIAIQQERLAQQESQREADEARIKQLEDELKQLKQQLEKQQQEIKK